MVIYMSKVAEDNDRSFKEEMTEVTGIML